MSDKYDTTNVVVLGDSFTFGHGVNDEDVYTEIMSERLTDTYAVINGGMSGWGIDSEIKWYFKTGRLYRPKYVVLQFTANDPDDSFSGVTTIEDGEFAFHLNPSTRPAWQLFLSRSYIIQNSHLYSLLRSAFDPARRSPSRFGNNEIEDNKPQSNYVEMLSLFAKEIDKQGSMLIYLSVTHSSDGVDLNYHYDLQHFPIIEKEVIRLESQGLLQFVDLPLVSMGHKTGSPEGHQWGPDHHELVGITISDLILTDDKQDPADN